MYAAERAALGPRFTTTEYDKWRRLYLSGLVEANDVLGFSFWWRWPLIQQRGGDPRRPDHAMFIGYAYAVQVPHWMILVVTSVLPLAWCAGRARTARQRARAARRQQGGLCPACGYDLRGSPGGGPCPECGAPRGVLVTKRILPIRSQDSI